MLEISILEIPLLQSLEDLDFSNGNELCQLWGIRADLFGEDFGRCLMGLAFFLGARMVGEGWGPHQTRASWSQPTIRIGCARKSVF